MKYYACQITEKSVTMIGHTIQGCQLSRIWRDSHAFDKFTHAFKNDHTHTHAISINRKYSTIIYHCKTNCNIVYCFSCCRIIRCKFYSSFPCWQK